MPDVKVVGEDGWARLEGEDDLQKIKGMAKEGKLPVFIRVSLLLFFSSLFLSLSEFHW